MDRVYRALSRLVQNHENDYFSSEEDIGALDRD